MGKGGSVWTVAGRFGVWLLSATLFATPVLGQVEVTAGAAQIRISGQIGIQAETTTCNGFPPSLDSACERQEPSIDLFMRRARILFDAKLNDWLEFRIQPDFRDIDGVVLRDAWGRMVFDPAARLTIGHMKRPFAGFFFSPSTYYRTVERRPVIPGVRAAPFNDLVRFDVTLWDTGVMLDGRTHDGRFGYWVGAFNGRSLSDATDLNTEKQFIGRGEVTFEVGGMPLDFAGAVALTDVPFERQSGAIDGTYFTLFELWTELGAYTDPGLHIQAGLVLGENPTQNVVGDAPDFEAKEDLANLYQFQVIGSWKVPVEGVKWVEGFEPVLRIYRGDPNVDVDDDAGWGLSPGGQLFFRDRTKLVLSWDFALFDAEELRTENSFKAHFQVHF
jgi:hypothetical protein